MHKTLSYPLPPALGSDDGDGLLTMAFGGGVERIYGNQVLYFGGEICRSKRPHFTKLVFWGKIGVI